MLAAPPTRMSSLRCSGRTRRVIDRKQSKSASRIGVGTGMCGFGMVVVAGGAAIYSREA